MGLRFNREDAKLGAIPVSSHVTSTSTTPPPLDLPNRAVDWELLQSGTTGQVLTANADGSIGWANATPMTTAGDVIYGGTSGTATRLGIGTAGQALFVNSGATAPTWRALLAADFPGVPMFLKSGMYYYLPLTGISTTTTNQNVNGTLTVLPLFIPVATTLIRIGGEITSAGSANGVVRLGIWNDSGSGYPGTLVLDAGTIDGTSATVQEITINQLLNPGLYWIGGVTQGSPSPTLPTVRIINGKNNILIGSSSLFSADQSVASYTMTGVTGALGTFTATPATTTYANRMFIKIA